MNFKNRIRGKKAFDHGHSFETRVRAAAQTQNILFQDIPDSGRRVGPHKFIQITSPFDCFLVHNGVAVFLDAKSFDSDRINYSKVNAEQVQNLLAIEKKGCTAGYIIYFRKENAVCFVRASELFALKQRESLHGRDTIYLGSNEEFYLGRLFSLHLEDPNGPKRNDSDGRSHNNIRVSGEGPV